MAFLCNGYIAGPRHNHARCFIKKKEGKKKSVLYFTSALAILFFATKFEFLN